MKNKLPYEATSKAIQGYSESVIAKSETNDCVVRAFASAFDITYDKAHKYVKEKFGRKDRQGTYGTVTTLNKMSEKTVEIVRDESYIKLIIKYYFRVRFTYLG